MSIQIEHLTKRFGDGDAVVDDVSLAIGDGELFVLLGPSGSGKSTLLRMIAGLTDIDAGSIVLHGRDMTAVSPKDRGIGFVFQHYALFRHMSVADNVEFALRVRGVPRARCRERREELLQLVGLAGFAERYPRQLSGGQQQRVALARALAHEPQVLLLDEPFGALDAKIRLELRHAFRAIQRELSLTTVFVTHDQEEAFELADRLGVMRNGRLLEVGAPMELYHRPRSPFVATFLGAANLMVGEARHRSVRIGPVELPLATALEVEDVPKRTQVLFRPEDVEVTADEHGAHPRLGRGRVEEHVAVGGFERLRFRLPLLGTGRSVSPPAPWGADYLPVVVVRPQHEAAALPLAAGDAVWLAVRRFHVLVSARLKLLIDPGLRDQELAAASLGRQIAERIDAHVTLASHDGAWVGPSEPEGETEDTSEGFDIAVLRLESSLANGRWSWLAHVRHHLLLVAHAAPVPSRFLVCVGTGESAKAEIRFAERLAWQLGAAATVLTVLPDGTDVDAPPAYVTRFIGACVAALSARGVVARARLRRGPVLREVLAELADGNHDLVVVGMPHTKGRSRKATHSGLLGALLRAPPPCPILAVRR